MKCSMLAVLVCLLFQQGLGQGLVPRRIRGLRGGSLVWADSRSCVRWFYTTCNDLAQIDRIEVLNGFTGHVEVPEYIDGRYVEQNVKLFKLLERLPTLKEVTLNPSNSNFVVVGGLVCDKEQDVVVLCPRGAKEITVPANVRDVSSIFDYSSDLQSICVAPGNRHFTSHDGVLYGKDMTTLIRCPNAAKKVDIPDGVKIIGKRAFCGCKSLSEVRIPDSVTEIQAAVFSSCTGLCSVVLSKNLTGISRCMFSDCTSLKSITLPQSIRKIDWGAFIDCCSLQSVLVDASEDIECVGGQALRVEDAAFLRCGNLTSVDLPGSDVLLFGKPLGGCTNLTALSFLPRMQHVWTGALKDTGYYRAMSNGTPLVFHSRLMGVKEPFPAVLEIPSGVVEIAEAAFRDNKDLKSVVIPASVTNIGSRAFAGCSQLETVTIPLSVARIGYDSFSNCTNLKTIITATDDTNRVARIEKAFGREMKVFENGKLVVLPKSEKTKQGDSAKSRTTSRRQTSSERVWRDPQTGIEWRFSVYEEKASLGSTRLANGRALVDVSYAGDLVIPERLDGYPVASVHDHAFEGCTNLTSICIPRTVDQFRVQLSSFVSLTNVTVDAGNATYRSSGRFLTSANGKVLLGVCAGGVKRIDIPDGIEEISWGCFWNAYWIEDVRIPSSVWSAGAEAFSGMWGLAQKHDPGKKGFVVLDGWLIPTAYVKRRKLTVPNGVRHIAHVDSSFSVWPDVYEVKFSEGLETIGQGVFSGANIETIEFPRSMRRCDGFGKKRGFGMRRPFDEIRMERPLRNVIFNSSDVSFSLPDSVRRVTFAAGVTDIGVNCEGLRRPGLYSGLSGGLSGGKGVTTVVLPAGLRSIHSLPDFPELTEITIPSSVTNIGKTVFQGCEKLKSVGVEKNGSVELVPIDEFRKRWNLFFPDGNLHLTDAKTEIRWLCKRGGPLLLRSGSDQDFSSVRIVGVEEGDAPSTLAIPETLAGLTVDDVDWDKMALPSAVELRIPRAIKDFRIWLVAKAMPNLQSIVVEEGNESYRSSDGVLCDAKTMSVLYCPSARKGRVTIAEGVKSVAGGPWRSAAGGAFSGCTNVTEIVLPSSLKTIGARAFKGCSRLEKVSLPEGLCKIGEGAFDGCVKLFEKAKRYDGFYVLDGWAVDPWGIGVLEHGALGGGLVLPDGVRGVADSTFKMGQAQRLATNETWTAKPILSVTFPKSLRHIGYDAFYGAEIERLALPDGICSIGATAFSSCTNLLSVSIPQTVETWCVNAGRCAGSGVFRGCTRLKDVRIAEGLRKLPTYGFDRCFSIVSVEIPASVTNGLESAFSGCPTLQTLEVSPENPMYKSINSVVYTKDGKKLVFCPQSKRTLDIPDGVESVGSFALGQCRLLMEMRVPATVREIEFPIWYGACVPERILTSPGDADRICELVRKDGRPNLKSGGREDRFVVDGDAVVRKTSRGERHGDRAETVSWQRWRDPETGIAWLYSVQGDDAVDVRTEFLEGYKGHLEVPAQLGGKQVSGLLGLYGGGDVTSLSLPMSVTNVNSKALASCTKLKSVKMNVDGALKTIGMEDLRKQWDLSGSKKPAFLNLRKGGSLRARRFQRRQQEAAAKAQTDQAKAQCEAERAKQRAQLIAIQEELNRVRAAKAAAGEKQKQKDK